MTSAVPSPGWLSDWNAPWATSCAPDAGPDLRVYLSTDTDASDFVDLGKLKGNSGNQSYEIPVGTDTAKYNQALIWCRAFTVSFTAAELKPAG